MKNVFKYYKTYSVIVIPVIFEIVNEVTGSWKTQSGGINITIGKFITIMIAVFYIIQTFVFIKKDIKEAETVSNQNYKISKLEKECSIYKATIKSLCNILNYTTDKIKDQITYYKRKQEINTEYVNIGAAATRLCESIYEGIMVLTDRKCDVTVNYYRKHTCNKKDFSIMLAHEGYNTNPKNYGKNKLLKDDKNAFYCEHLLIDDNPEAIFWKNKEEVARAFRIKPDKCKYNQYVGIPVRRMGAGKVALIEIVVHNNSIVWNNQEEVRAFTSKFCEPFKDYILLIDRLSLMYEAIENVERGAQNESREDCEILCKQEEK